MRHICVLLLLCFASAFAQETPRAEVFIGYSYLNADTNGLTSRQSANGGQFSFVANMNQWVGLETNFSGYYKSIPVTTGVNASLRDFALFFGPRLRYKFAFVHAMVGLDDLGGSVSGVSGTNGSFAGAIGGGALFKFSRYVGVEGSTDYGFSRHNLFGGGPATQNHVRAAVGIVFTFGQIGEAAASAARGQAQQPASSRPAVRSAGMPIAALGIAVVSAANNAGAQVTDVTPNSVAELAGLHPDDIINSVNGSPVKTSAELANALSGLAPATKVKVGFMVRGIWQTESTLVLGEH